MLRKPFLPLALTLAVLARAQIAPAQAPCGDLDAVQQAEQRAWQKSAAKSLVSGRGGEPLPLIVAGNKARVRFHAGHDVLFAFQRRPKLDQMSLYAGRLALEPPRDGEYRILVGQRVWVDIVDPATGTALTPTTSERQLRCAGVAKNIGFVLAANKRYWLQISDGDEAETDVLVALQPK